MIALASIAFNNSRVISEQIRLLQKYLQDDFDFIVVDQSTDDRARGANLRICDEAGVKWVALPTRQHHEGLNWAAEYLLASGCAHIGFLDHDVFPVKPTRLTPLIEEAGFYGIGQRHPATGHLYLWPGFCFFSREWLNGRPLDFSGLRDGHKRNDGDTGSSLWPLFEKEDWHNLYKVDHSYQAIRRPDEYGLQSWGYEVIGDWIHFSNASRWMRVPRPAEREKLLFDLLASV